MKIKKQDKQIIVKTQKEIDKILKNLDFEIKNDNDFQNATKLLKLVAEQKRIILERKNKIIKPLNDALVEVRELFKPAEEKLQILDEKLRKEIEKYSMLKEKEKEEEIKMIASEIQNKNDLDKAIIELKEKGVQIKNVLTDEIYFRKTKKIIVENENLLPREYLMPDMTKIRNDVLSGKDIPGVKVVEEKIVVVK
jgi:uncharacterized coiled-coil protein SlyX